MTLVRQYAGAEGSPTFQDTAMTYDGYGRLKTKNSPEQNAGTVTTWDYNSDDTIQKITDARGSVSNFSYNSRHLITGMTYTPSTGVADTPDVSIGYDAAGNRSSMADGLGSKTYTYNQVSRMMSEARTFTGVGSFTLSYDYNLGGGLKSVTDHTNQRVNYSHDSAGNLTNLTGTNYSITQFINSVSYRAWGSPKQVAYGNGRTLSINYNSRLQASHLEIPSGAGFPATMSKDYQYFSDGRVSYSRDLLDARYDRAYSYDQSARITRALSGADARGQTSPPERPYNQISSYDAFDHLTNRTTRHWSKTLPYIASDAYTNNRRNGWQYDAAGNLLSNSASQYTYDAAGRMTSISGGNINQFFDGDGQRVKTTEPNVVTYYLRSSVVGQVIEELDGNFFMAIHLL